jgi:acetylornithine aminotransferase
MLKSLHSRLESMAQVREVRGKGLMIGIELVSDANHLRNRALEQGVLLNITRDHVIRLLPPLIIDRDQAEQIVDVVCSLVEELA